ncbi:MAG: ACP S-malonyltransferase [Alphaproteobacteria bacterium]
MNNFNLIFPGQGSQTVGMGLDLYQNHKRAREVFDEVDEALNFRLSKIIFEGPEESLKLTVNTQPAIMATSLAVVKVLEDELKKDISSFSEVVLGHSLGEYSALCSINSISISETAKILQLRGKAMQESVGGIETKMVAVIGLDIVNLETELRKFTLNKNEVCEIANDNCPGQIILSGTKNAIEEFSIILKKIGARSVIDLNVSAPFHCSLMNEASKIMKKVLEVTDLKNLNTKFISNVNAKFENDTNKIKSLLIDQISSRVRWRESILLAENTGPKVFVELGNGKVLSGMNKRISKKISSQNLADMRGIGQFIDSNKDIL